jgi:CBS domain-containing protein
LSPANSQPKHYTPNNTLPPTAIAMPLSTRRRIPLTARDVMAVPPVTIRQDARMSEAARLMCEHRIGSVLVVNDEGRLIGIVTERDLACAVAKECVDAPIWSVMTENPVTVKPETTIDEVLRIMGELGVRHIPVVDEDEKPVGVISVRDIVALVRLVSGIP